MDRSATESLVQFCIVQRNAFAADDWRQRFECDGEAVALAAKYLSMTSWYGHEEELERIAATTHLLVESSLGLYRESQTIGFDLPYFAATVRIGVTQARFEQEARRTSANLAAAAAANAARLDHPPINYLP